MKLLLSFFLISLPHLTLSDCLKNCFGFEDSCQPWFSSYLNSRKQAVSLKDTISSIPPLAPYYDSTMIHVLGPLSSLSIRLLPLGSVISRNFLKYISSNADDTQLYIPFKPAGLHQSSEVAIFFLQPSVTLFIGPITTNSC